MPTFNLRPKYGKEEFARRGQELFETAILPELKNTDTGKIVAIDIESGQFALGRDTLAAARLLRARLPDAQIWCVRVGSPAVHRIG